MNRGNLAWIEHGFYGLPWIGSSVWGFCNSLEAAAAVHEHLRELEKTLATLAERDGTRSTRDGEPKLEQIELSVLGSTTG